MEQSESSPPTAETRSLPLFHITIVIRVIKVVVFVISMSPLFLLYSFIITVSFLVYISHTSIIIQHSCYRISYRISAKENHISNNIVSIGINNINTTVNIASRCSSHIFNSSVSLLLVPLITNHSMNKLHNSVLPPVDVVDNRDDMLILLLLLLLLLLFDPQECRMYPVLACVSASCCTNSSKVTPPSQHQHVQQVCRLCRCVSLLFLWDRQHA